jgi:hypothetical protein
MQDELLEDFVGSIVGGEQVVDGGEVGAHEMVAFV